MKLPHKRYETHRKNSWWKPHKDEQILEETPQKTAVVQPLIFQLSNHPSITKKTYGALLEKPWRTHKWRYPMNSNIGMDAPVLVD